MREKYIQQLDATEKELLEVMTNKVISTFYLTPEFDCVLTYHEYGDDKKLELRTSVRAIDALMDKMREIDKVTSSVTKIYHNGRRLLEIFELYAMLRQDGIFDIA